MSDLTARRRIRDLESKLNDLARVVATLREAEAKRLRERLKFEDDL
jgi:hypothetical protein